MELEEAKYIAWVYYSHEGWSPNPYKTLKEAIEHESYGSRKVITLGLVKYEIKEVEEVKIKQISAVLEPDLDQYAAIYGLGDDGNVYWWDQSQGIWVLYSTL